ncbi:uncharacterized protein EI97DRAFT_454545 [Westerdykella ornata]|uniref:Uncharacterized protein n=1 Tax=Westerdykella ornata TaxID=318751 RepID=A0A6A6K1T1_WESOR|nr:uncharacterized protein EI97DRAFT_454545 [Westerdykella ornata]KAF2281339.1 hypothetical protein EI97DRAFT_454545 [Westerdykella ornata]
MAASEGSSPESLETYHPPTPHPDTGVQDPRTHYFRRRPSSCEFTDARHGENEQIGMDDADITQSTFIDQPKGGAEDPDDARDVMDMPPIYKVVTPSSPLTSHAVRREETTQSSSSKKSGEDSPNLSPRERRRILEARVEAERLEQVEEWLKTLKMLNVGDPLLSEAGISNDGRFNFLTGEGEEDDSSPFGEPSITFLSAEGSNSPQLRRSDQLTSDIIDTTTEYWPQQRAPLPSGHSRAVSPAIGSTRHREVSFTAHPTIIPEPSAPQAGSTMLAPARVTYLQAIQRQPPATKKQKSPYRQKSSSPYEPHSGRRQTSLPEDIFDLNREAEKDFRLTRGAYITASNVLREDKDEDEEDLEQYREMDLAPLDPVMHVESGNAGDLIVAGVASPMRNVGMSRSMDNRRLDFGSTLEEGREEKLNRGEMSGQHLKKRYGRSIHHAVDAGYEERELKEDLTKVEPARETMSEQRIPKDREGKGMLVEDDGEAKDPIDEGTSASALMEKTSSSGDWEMVSKANAGLLVEDDLPGMSVAQRRVLSMREQPSFINCVALIPMAMVAALVWVPAGRAYGYVHDAFSSLMVDAMEEAAEERD